MSSVPNHSLPKQDQDSVETCGRARRNIFEDPAIVEAGKNDPFIRFISQNWRLLLAALVAIGLGIVGYSQMTEIALQKRVHATRALRDVQEAYQEIIEQREAMVTATREQQAAADEKTRAEAAERTKKSADNVKQQEERLLSKVVELEAVPAFAAFAELYRGLVAAGRADFAAVQVALGATAWESAGKAGSPERASAELVALGLAKALSDSDQHLDVAKSALKSLADRGDLAAVRAADAFAALSTTPEEKEQAKTIIQALQTRMPAQQKLLSAALERLS